MDGVVATSWSAATLATPTGCLGAAVPLSVMEDNREPSREGGGGLAGIEALALADRAEAYGRVLDDLRTELEADGRQ